MGREATADRPYPFEANRGRGERQAFNAKPGPAARPVNVVERAIPTQKAEGPARDVGPRPVLDAQRQRHPATRTARRHPERLLAHRRWPRPSSALRRARAQDVMGPDGGVPPVIQRSSPSPPPSPDWCPGEHERPDQARHPASVTPPANRWWGGRDFDPASASQNREPVRDRRPDEEGIHQREMRG